MIEKHIILYTSRPVSDASLRGNKSLNEASLNARIEELDTSKVAEMKRRNPEIVATAPSIPLSLIEPLDLPQVVGLNNGQSAWGVEAVGSLTSPYTGKGVKLAILDTGIDRAHEAFLQSLNILEVDFTGDGKEDLNGHGTHCAGTIFGRAVNGVRIGVAPGINEVLVGKVIGSRGGSSDSLVQAIIWAVKERANIISMSLGIDFPGLVKRYQDNGMKTQPATSLALEKYRQTVLLFERLNALTHSQAAGGIFEPALVIAAAGNESRRPDYEIAVSPPAISNGILSVGALGKKDGGLFVAPFSNSGPVLSGPGVGILSAAAGTGNGLKELNGTSMATPHVAGVAALWIEKMKAEDSFSVDQLLANLRAFSSKKGLQQELSVNIGAGIVQAPM